MSMADTSELARLKFIESVLDEGPVLMAEQIKLALWMRRPFFLHSL